MVENFNLGDIVQMKKQHPCGTYEFEIIRVGADIKLKCTGCGRFVMIPIIINCIPCRAKHGR